MGMGDTNRLSVLIVVGACAGDIAGWFLGARMEAVAFPGTFFLNALCLVAASLIIHFLWKTQSHHLSLECENNHYLKDIVAAVMMALTREVRSIMGSAATISS